MFLDDLISIPGNALNTITQYPLKFLDTIGNAWDKTNETFTSLGNNLKDGIGEITDTLSSPMFFMLIGLGLVLVIMIKK